MQDNPFKDIRMIQAQKLAEAGHTDAFIADFFGVTLHLWRKYIKTHPEFKDKLDAWKKRADDRVERTLFDKAVGFTRAEPDEVDDKGIVVAAGRKTYYPPSSNDIRLWLTNRKPDVWKDRKAVTNDGNLNVGVVVDEAAAKERLANTVAKVLVNTEDIEETFEDALS